MESNVESPRSRYDVWNAYGDFLSDDRGWILWISWTPMSMRDGTLEMKTPCDDASIIRLAIAVFYVDAFKLLKKNESSFQLVDTGSIGCS